MNGSEVYMSFDLTTSFFTFCSCIPGMTRPSFTQLSVRVGTHISWRVPLLCQVIHALDRFSGDMAFVMHEKAFSISFN